MKLLPIVILFFTTSFAFAYPDLYLNSSDISFSVDYPTSNVHVQISATISNAADNYTNPALGYYPPMIVTYSDIYEDQWIAQSFYPDNDMNIVGVSAQIWDQGIDDSLTINIETDKVFFSSHVPSGICLATCTMNIIGEAEYGLGVQCWMWTDFMFPEHVSLTANTTYWIVAKSTAATYFDGYGWLDDLVGDYAIGSMHYSSDQGVSWSTQTSDMFFQVYQTTVTTVNFYNGDPESGGTLIGTDEISPVEKGENKTARCAWTATPTGRHDIYVVVNPNSYIAESNTSNNKAKKTITVIYNHLAKNTIESDDGSTTVVLGAGCMNEDFFVEIVSDPTDDSALDSKISAANNKLYLDSDPFTVPLNDTVKEIKAYDSDGNLFSGDFRIPPEITICYNTSDPEDRIVDGTNPPVLEETLKIYWLDEEHNLWVKLSGSVVDTENNKVSASVSHFTIFSLMGSGELDLSDSYAFPVPFIPSRDEKITFTNLSPLCTIKIYTLKGELIKRLEHIGGQQEYWENIDAGSGVYLYIIENEKEKKKGKLMIIR